MAPVGFGAAGQFQLLGEIRAGRPQHQVAAIAAAPGRPGARYPRRASASAGGDGARHNRRPRLMAPAPLATVGRYGWCPSWNGASWPPSSPAAYSARWPGCCSSKPPPPSRGPGRGRPLRPTASGRCCSATAPPAYRSACRSPPTVGRCWAPACAAPSPPSPPCSWRSYGCWESAAPAWPPPTS
jgi:hypothetical protein